MSAASYFELDGVLAVNSFGVLLDAGSYAFETSVSTLAYTTIFIPLLVSVPPLTPQEGPQIVSRPFFLGPPPRP